jgi:hypothetical protein
MVLTALNGAVVVKRAGFCANTFSGTAMMKRARARFFTAFPPGAYSL